MNIEDEIAKLKPLLRAFAEDARANAGEHLEVELLAGYHFKEISGDDAERVRNHLIMCRECASRLLGLVGFYAPVGEESDRPLPAESGIAETMREAPSLFQRLRERIFTPPFVYLVEGVSLAAILALIVWVAFLKRENRELIARDSRAVMEIEKMRGQRDESRSKAEQFEAQLNSPNINFYLRELLPVHPRGVDSSGATNVELSASDTYFALVAPPPEREYPEYAIEILGSGGVTVVGKGGMRQDEKSGRFIISLPRALFPTGIYLINVYGIGSGKRTKVSGGVVRIRYKQ
jgi:hypothetical protein